MTKDIRLGEEFFSQYLPELSGAEAKVFLILLRQQANPVKGRAGLTRKELAAKTKLSVVQVGSALRKLEGRGLVRLNLSEMGVLLYAELHESLRFNPRGEK
jgi:DNA-binding MarR family transcriptional regulator